MRFVLKNGATKDQTMIIDRNIWSGKTTVIVDDVPAIKVARLTYSYIDKDENRIQVKIQGNDIRGLEVNIDERYIVPLNKKLSGAELTLAFIPLIATLASLFVFGGNGVIGGIAGFMGFLFSYLTASLIRQANHVFLKIMLSIAISGASVFILLFLIILF